MKFNALIPELTVSNVDITKEFYISQLGFTLEYERKNEKFVFLSFEASQFMFEEIHETGWHTGTLEFPFGRGINFSIRCNNIDRVFERVIGQKIKPYRTLHETIYLCDGKEERQREFLIQDPDGYLLRVTD